MLKDRSTMPRRVSSSVVGSGARSALAATGLAVSLLALPANGNAFTAGFGTPTASAAPGRVQGGCPPTIARGARGDYVRYAQILLNENMPDDPPIPVDGIFGEQTERRVREYPSVLMPVDGVIGPKTWDYLGAC